MAERPVHFVPTDEGHVQPTRFAQSHWGDDHLNGPAVVGLAAWTLEQAYGLPDFLPAGLTVADDVHEQRRQRMEYINGDLTVALARLPKDDWIGLQADSHWTADGVSVGAATLFDGVAAFGTGVVTAISNPDAQIDFTNDPFPSRTP